MFRIHSTLLVLALLTAVEAQVYHSCPAHPEGEYENPLYDQWLSAFDVKHYHLTLEVSNTETHIEGVAEVVIEATRDMDTLVLELQDDLEVTAVETIPAGTSLDYGHFNQAIYIKLDRSYHTGELCRVKISYGGDAGNDRGFFAGINSKKDSNYGFDVTYTLSEPHNAKDWFPVKQVLEDKID